MGWRYTLGVEQCALQVQDETIKILCSDSIWFKEFSNFIQRNKIKVETNITWNQKQRENDKYIINIARKQGYI
jgi:F0F1-type ATP synthase epsilon subunit